MDVHGKVPDLARRLLSSQGIGVLATSGAQGAHLSLVAFAALWEERILYFATPKSTRKFANLLADPRAVLLVDDRVNQPADLHRAAAVTVRGSAREMDREARDAVMATYLRQHPHLGDFARAPSIALVSLRMEEIEVVQAFQQVTRLSFQP